MASKQQAKNQAKITQTEVIDDDGVVHGAVATVANAGSTFALPANMKLKRVITVPSLVLKMVGTAHTLQFTSPIVASTVVIKGKEDEKPARIADVINHEDDKHYKLLVPTVVESNLDKEYPNHSYVGLSFYIQNLGKRKEGQRYVDYGIAEVCAEG